MTSYPSRPLARPLARPRALARPLARLLVGVLAATVLLSTLVGTGTAHASPVEDYSDYEPQETCASAAKPGTEYLMRWLVGQYRGTGLGGTLRGCESGGQSEHKDGRALDWGVDAADPAQAAVVASFLERIFATDAAGNEHALARRLGIMYIIWDDHMYSSYREFSKQAYTTRICPKPNDCSKTTRHRDHVHISLSYSGGAAQTSFYRSRNVASIPVLIPGTLQLDPVKTAIVTMTVPATGAVVTSGFTLTAGTTYRIVGDGRYRYGPGSMVADSACRWSTSGWIANPRGLMVNGTSPWAVECDGEDTHEATYTPTKTARLRLRVGAASPAGDGGSLTFHILREDLRASSVASHPAAASPAPRAARKPGQTANRLKREKVTVRAASRWGSRTEHSLRKNTRYRVVVTGLARSGDEAFDASCVKYDGLFRGQHTLDLARPAADHLSLFLQGVRVNLRVPRSEALCSSEHRYVGTHTAVVRGKARVKVWDPYTYDDNAGSLMVKLTRVA